MIVPDDRDATSERSLAAAVWLTERARQTPYSTRVDSIANFPHMTADGDALSVRDLVHPAKLSDAEERRRIRATALADPRIAGNLLARDGGVSAVNVTVKLPEEGNAASIAEIAGFARGVAAEAGKRFPGIDFRLVGTVIVNQTFTEASVATMGTVLPASLAAMGRDPRYPDPRVHGSGRDRRSRHPVRFRRNGAGGAGSAFRSPRPHRRHRSSF